jgi:hypothetical protein
MHFKVCGGGGGGGAVLPYMVYPAIALSCAGPAAGKMAEFFQHFFFVSNTTWSFSLSHSLALTYCSFRSGSLLHSCSAGSFGFCKSICLPHKIQLLFLFIFINYTL